MTKQETTISQKRRGPKPTGKGTPVLVRLQPPALERLDTWIARQPDPKPSRPEAVRSLMDRGLEADAEDRADVAELEAWRANPGATIPASVADAVMAGTHPLAAWRSHLGITRRELAAAAGVDDALIKEIEAGKTKIASRALQKLAKGLGIDPALLRKLL